MAKKKTEEKTEKPAEIAAGDTGTRPVPAEVAAPAPRRKRTPRTSAKPAAARPRPETGASPEVAEPPFQAVLAEIRSVKELLQGTAAHTASAAAASGADAALESSVDSLRRLLSELIEQRMESVVRDLADIRREASTLAARQARGILERLDDMLERLGAVRFEAEPMDVVDPLIHAVAEERQEADAPDGVILATVRPGFRTARGLIACKAAVAVNRRA